MNRTILIAFCLSALMMANGCGVSKGVITDAEKRISVLLEKGVPDSSLSRAKVFLYQAKDAKIRGNNGLARASADSMRILIARAEEQYSKDIERLKPYLAQIRGKFQKERSSLTGLHLAKVDSLIKIIDSLTAINWLLSAEAKAVELDTMLPRIQFDQQRANELRSRILGSWVCTNTTTHGEDKSVNAVEKKVFTFSPDGSGALVENKQGKSSPFLKEDWEFKSWGSWDLFGDTIFIRVNRFAAVRQNFEEYHQRDGKVIWEKKAHPTYDSTITDGSQDRWISFTDLTTDFKRQ